MLSGRTLPTLLLWLGVIFMPLAGGSKTLIGDAACADNAATLEHWQAVYPALVLSEIVRWDTHHAAFEAEIKGFESGWGRLCTQVLAIVDKRLRAEGWVVAGTA